jgi:hypothetical protein
MFSKALGLLKLWWVSRSDAEPFNLVTLKTPYKPWQYPDCLPSPQIDPGPTSEEKRALKSTPPVPKPFAYSGQAELVDAEEEEKTTAEYSVEEILLVSSFLKKEEIHKLLNGETDLHELTRSYLAV